MGFKAGLELAEDSGHSWAHPTASNSGSVLESTSLKPVFDHILFISLRTHYEALALTSFVKQLAAIRQYPHVAEWLRALEVQN